MKNIISFLFSLVCLSLVNVGCSTIPAEYTEDQVLAAMAVFHEAEIAGDMDAIMNRYSDSFADPMGTDKAAVRGFFQMAVGSGALRSLQVDMQEVSVSVDQGVAVVEPVHYVSGFGASSYRYTLRKEADGEWRFINSEIL